MWRNWSKREKTEMLLFAGPATIICAVAGIGIILSVISMVLFPSGHGSRENARRASCQSNLKQIALSMHIYAQDNDEKLPVFALGKMDAQTIWTNTVLPYINHEPVFQCPSQDNPDQTISGQINADYFFNIRLSGLKISNAAKFKTVILVAEGSSEKSPVFPHFDGANYAFADGHVKWLKPEKISDSPTNKTGPTFRVR